MWRSYEYKCQECDFRLIDIYHKGEQPDTLDCNQCGDIMHQCLAAPNVLKASQADGIKRGEKWQAHKEAASLEQEASRANKRGDRKEASVLKKHASTLVSRVKHKKDTFDK